MEVLIALVIFGISAMVVLEQTSRSIKQQAHLEEKTFALWTAENSLASLRLKKEWPNTGGTEIQTTLAQRDWLIEQKIEKTANPLLRKITVSVSREDKAAPLVSLTGFVGEH